MLEKGHYSEADARSIFLQIIRAIQYLHSRCGVCRRLLGCLAALALLCCWCMLSAAECSASCLSIPVLCSGIVHRDLKLENLLLVNKWDTSHIKIAGAPRCQHTRGCCAARRRLPPVQSALGAW